MPTWIASLFSALALLSLVISGVSLWFCSRQPSNTSLVKDLHAVSSDLANLYDKVETWQRRDRVRRLQQSHEPQESLPAPGSPEYKHWLRRRARLGSVLQEHQT